MLKFDRNWNLLLLTGWCSLIFILSHQGTSSPLQLPHPPSATVATPAQGLDFTLFVFLGWDKLHHAAAYGIMAFFTWRLLKTFPMDPVNLFFASLLFCAIYGISDEWHQSFIAGREADVLDWLADITGATLTLLFASARDAGWYRLRLAT